MEQKTRIRFRYPDEEWGIPVYPTGGKNWGKLRDSDLDHLKEMRSRFRDEFEFKPVPWKFHLETMLNPGDQRNANWLLAVLHRLAIAGYIEKYAKQLHTQSFRPEYISWYIWEDLEPAPLDSLDIPVFVESV